MKDRSVCRAEILSSESMADGRAEVFIVPIIIGALGSVTKKQGKNLEMMNLVKGVEPLQKACLLGTARIIRKVLDFGS